MVTEGEPVPLPAPFIPELIGHGETLMSVREYHDEDSESPGTEFRKLEDALFSDAVRLLDPNELFRLVAETTVHDAIMDMAANRKGIGDDRGCGRPPSVASSPSATG
jgi:hypothetical protein